MLAPLLVTAAPRGNVCITPRLSRPYCSNAAVLSGSLVRRRRYTRQEEGYGAATGATARSRGAAISEQETDKSRCAAQLARPLNTHALTPRYIPAPPPPLRRLDGRRPPATTAALPVQGAMLQKCSTRSSSSVSTWWVLLGSRKAELPARAGQPDCSQPVWRQVAGGGRAVGGLGAWRGRAWSQQHGPGCSQLMRHKIWL